MANANRPPAGELDGYVQQSQQPWYRFRTQCTHTSEGWRCGRAREGPKGGGVHWVLERNRVLCGRRYDISGTLCSNIEIFSIYCANSPAHEFVYLNTGPRSSSPATASIKAPSPSLGLIGPRFARDNLEIGLWASTLCSGADLDSILGLRSPLLRQFASCHRCVQHE